MIKFQSHQNIQSIFSNLSLLNRINPKKVKKLNDYLQFKIKYKPIHHKL